MIETIKNLYLFSARDFVWIIFSGILVSLGEFIFTALFYPLLNLIAVKMGGEVVSNAYANLLLMVDESYVIAIVALGFVISAISRISGYTYLQYLVQRQRTKSMLRHLSGTLKYGRLRKELKVETFLSESDFVVNNLYIPVSSFFSSIFTLILLLSILMVINYQAALIGFSVFGAIYAFLYYASRSYLSNKGAFRSEMNSRRFNMVRDISSTRKEMRLYGNNDFFLDKLKGVSYAYDSTLSAMTIISGLPRHLVEYIGVILLVSVVLLFKDSQDFSKIIIEIVAFVVVAYKLLPALQALFQANTYLQFGQATNKLIMGDSKREYELLCLKKIGRLETKKIVITTEDGRKVSLPDIAIDEGEKIHLTGPSGVGKSSLIDVLAGFIEQTSGYIIVDGVRIDARNIQCNIAYVGQSYQLIDGTLRENIQFGRKENSKKLNELINEFELSDLDMVENVYEKVSGGQAQRIVIARALYEYKPIVLLDEPTSALNYQLHNKVVEFVAKECDSIVVLISHANDIPDELYRRVELC
jgi:ATP-binding cassette, subfamily B, bacterial PglK